ncbi:MAG TPA: citramalate synthase [Firmicutes bacterium]|nr:citramalate synthase [Bacillota bacterium]
MRQVKLYDTTLRDGAQMEGISFSVEDKIRIAQRLDEFGVDYIEGGWPGSNPKDVEFFEYARSLKLHNAVISAFCSTRRAGVAAEDDANLAAVLKSGVRAAAVFGKSWDFHVTHALGTTLDENLRMIEDSVRLLKRNGLEVIYDAEHFFDGYKADRDYAMKTIGAAYEAGADVIVLCDTNGGTLPMEIDEIIRDVLNNLSGPVGIHAHNDSGVAVANTLIAVGLGVNHVQGTINGYGERCGNADLCSVIPSLKLKMGIECVTDEQLAGLTGLSRFIDEVANMRPNTQRPYVGRSVFTHKGGIHVSALMKHPETYEHIEPGLVGNRRRVVVSELAGASNIAYKAQEYSIPLERKSTGTKAVINAVKELEHQGYQFEGAEASFELLLKKTFGMHRSLFELEGFRLIVEKREANGEPVAEASIKLRVGDRLLHTVAEGNGPVNALDGALRKALEDVYPELKNIKLTDYKVRVIDEASGTSAKVRVLIESTNDRRTWGTVGVSTNIIEASWRALVDSIEYGLLYATGPAETEVEIEPVPGSMK